MSGTTVALRAPNGSVSLSALSNSSTHSAWGSFPKHYLQKGLDIPSTLLCDRPGLCSVSRSNSARVLIHRAKDTFRSFESSEPFQTVVVRSKDHFHTEEIMAKILKCADSCKKFSTSCAILFLCLALFLKRKRLDV